MSSETETLERQKDRGGQERPAEHAPVLGGGDRKHGFIRELLKQGGKILFLFFYTVLKFLRPVVHVRVGQLTYGRIGHLGPETELYLRRRHRNGVPKREWHVFITGKPANRQLLSMIKRRVPVLENGWLAKSWRTMRQSVEDPDFWIELPWHENEYEEFNDIPPQLAFTEEEEARGKDLLAGMGIKPGTPFVCFHARDKAYLDVAHNWQPREKWAYHDYRDTNVSRFLPAAEYLASLGLPTIRMGYIVERPVETGNPLIIDYATRHRSDFGDIYLPAKCKFFLGSCSGLVLMPTLFNVPIAVTNWIPVNVTPYGQRDLFIHKKMWSLEKKRFLTYREILALGADVWDRAQQYAGAGIEVVENTPEEILALAREMNDRLDGVWVAQGGDEELHERYRERFSPGYHCSKSPARIGTAFLRSNRNLLD